MHRSAPPVSPAQKALAALLDRASASSTRASSSGA
jgi:hypothetical protein